MSILEKYEVIVPLNGFVIYEVDAKSPEDAKRAVHNLLGINPTKVWHEIRDPKQWQAYSLDPFYDSYAESKFKVEPEGF